MLTIEKLDRVFFFKEKEQDIELADIDPSLSPQAVQNLYSMTYPILATATVQGPEIVEDRIRYRFVTTIGTKG